MATLRSRRIWRPSLFSYRAARHHIFSAIVIGDLSLIQTLVEQNAEALDRRMSRFEQKQSPLHYGLSRRRYDIATLLIDLGMDLEAEDAHGQTAIAAAMLRGDREAMTMLRDAGAVMLATTRNERFHEDMKRVGASVTRGVPMIHVRDVGRTMKWYVAIGFAEMARYEADGVANFGMLAFGGAALMLNMHGKSGPHDVSLWFYTDKVDELYHLLKSRQLAAAEAALTGEPGAARQGIDFEQDIEDMFYGARQFCIRDPNGYQLYFIKTQD